MSLMLTSWDVIFANVILMKLYFQTVHNAEQEKGSLEIMIKRSQKKKQFPNSYNDEKKQITLEDKINNSINEMICCNLLQKNADQIKLSEKFRMRILELENAPNFKDIDEKIIFSMITTCPFLTTEQISTYFEIIDGMLLSQLEEGEKNGKWR